MSCLLKQAVFLIALATVTPAMSSGEQASIVSEHPSLSPTACEAAISADFDGRQGLWVVDLHSGKLRKLVALDNASAVEPVWSSDGQTIVFTSVDDVTSSLWAVQADGTNLRKLGSDGVESRSASWSPDARQIVFA
jgi:TolB protein